MRSLGRPNKVPCASSLKQYSLGITIISRLNLYCESNDPGYFNYFLSFWKSRSEKDYDPSFALIWQRRSVFPSNPLGCGWIDVCVKFEKFTYCCSTFRAHLKGRGRWTRRAKGFGASNCRRATYHSPDWIWIHISWAAYLRQSVWKLIIPNHSKVATRGSSI